MICLFFTTSLDPTPNAFAPSSQGSRQVLVEALGQKQAIAPYYYYTSTPYADDMFTLYRQPCSYCTPCVYAPSTQGSRQAMIEALGQKQAITPYYYLLLPSLPPPVLMICLPVTTSHDPTPCAYAPSSQGSHQALVEALVQKRAIAPY